MDDDLGVKLQELWIEYSNTKESTTKVPPEELHRKILKTQPLDRINRHLIRKETNYSIPLEGKHTARSPGILEAIVEVGGAIAGAGGGVVGYAHILAYLFENGSHSDSPIGMKVLFLTGFCGAPFWAIGAGVLGGAIGYYLIYGIVAAGGLALGLLTHKNYVHDTTVLHPQ